MTEKLSSFAFQLGYLFSHLSLANVVDIALVAVVFFILLQALRRTRSLQLVRGAVAFAILAVALLAVLPLDTFSWLLRAVLLAGAVAWPIIFQEELRQALTGLGRVGRFRRGVGSAYDRFKTAIVTAATQLASRREGALMVLEGQTPLAEIIATGIPVQAERLTAELLESLFQPKTPLHDGAVVLRGDRLTAASCILPVQTEGTGSIHLGTRHRAALGLSSQVPDALTVVVSEETGHISVAQGGRLRQDLSDIQLEDWLDRFQDQLARKGGSDWRHFAGNLAGWFRGTSLRTTLSNLVLAVGLALIAWVSVVYQTDPPQQATIAGVPLTVTVPASDLILVQDLPETVSVRVQTTRDHLAELDAGSIRAELALEGLVARVHRVDVDVTLADERAQLVSVIPAYFDLTLEPLASRSLLPTINMPDLDSLPPGYALNRVRLSPETVTVRGPQSLVDRVGEARAELALEGRRADFQEALRLKLVDDDGEQVTDLQPTPESILATVSISRTFESRQVGVQAMLETTTLPRGYEVTRVRLSPSVVTLIGRRSGLEEAGDYLATAPINLSGVRSELTRDVPLVMPEGISALDTQGQAVTNVVARVTVAPATDYLALTKKPVVSGVTPSLAARLSPSQVTVLLIGPEPLLLQVEEEPGLVRVSLDLKGFEPGSYLLPLEIRAPEGLDVERFPTEIDVTIAEREEEPAALFEEMR
jgi:diadenylate cyclase